MTTVGDVFSIVAFLLGIFLTSWAAVLSFGLIFTSATQKAQDAVTHEPRKCLLAGATIAATVGTLSFVLIAQPNPGGKFVGLLVLISLLAVSVMGCAGLAQRVARRIQDLDPGLATYPAMLRSTALILGGSLLPILGWFLIAPALLIVSLGAGWKGISQREVRVFAQGA